MMDTKISIIYTGQLKAIKGIRSIYVAWLVELNWKISFEQNVWLANACNWWSMQKENIGDVLTRRITIVERLTKSTWGFWGDNERLYVDNNSWNGCWVWSSNARAHSDAKAREIQCTYHGK